MDLSSVTLESKFSIIHESFPLYSLIYINKG